MDGDLPETPLELSVRRSLLLGVKEALNNAAKYSNASEIFLRIHRRGQSLLVIIEDNGEGFDLAKVDPSRDGLTNMVERMKDVGGKCRIIAKPVPAVVWNSKCRCPLSAGATRLTIRAMIRHWPPSAASPPQPTAAVAGENSISPS